MNADTAVMEHFPKTLNVEESAAFLARLQDHFQEYGYCYYAVEIRETGEWIGFIGLAYQNYKTAFTPAVDIGWRLVPGSWGQGYATEGARRCLEHAFTVLNLDRVIATCTLSNKPSERVMQKLGMHCLGHLNHPKLKGYPEYERCLCYGIEQAEWRDL